MVDDSRSASGVVIVLAAGLIGVWYFQMTLWHTDLWGHLTYGRLMVESGAIPVFEPFIPSASKTPLLATAWLSQVVGYQIHNHFGSIGLKAAFGLSIATSWLLLTFALRRQSKSTVWSLLCGSLFLIIASQQLRIIRPQIAGLVLFCLLLLELSKEHLSRRSFVIVFGLFCVWANCHPSFPVGLGLLGALLIDRFRQSHVTLQQAAIMLATAVFGTFVNPYGPWLYQKTLNFAASPNLSSIVEWQPISFSTHQGQWVAGTAAGLIIAVGLSLRRPASKLSTVLPIGLTLLFVCVTVMLSRHSRFVLWWSVIACYLLAHCDFAVPGLTALDAILDRLKLRRNAVIALVVGCAVAWWSHDSQSETDQPTSRPWQFLSPYTPVAAVDSLISSHQKSGARVFASYEFSDYLLWKTWPDLQVIQTSHVHLLSPADWRSYLQIIRLQDGWQQQFDQLDVSVVVVDMQRHSHLANALQGTEDWELLHIDEVAIVLVKRETEPGNSKSL